MLKLILVAAIFAVALSGTEGKPAAKMGGVMFKPPAPHNSWASNHVLPQWLHDLNKKTDSELNTSHFLNAFGKK